MAEVCCGYPGISSTEVGFVIPSLLDQEGNYSSPLGKGRLGGVQYKAIQKAYKSPATATVFVDYGLQKY